MEGQPSSACHDQLGSEGKLSALRHEDSAVVAGVTRARVFQKLLIFFSHMQKHHLVWQHLDFCCDICMIATEFGVNDVKAWIHPACDGVILWGTFFWETLGSSGTNVHCFNSTACLRVVAQHVYDQCTHDKTQIISTWYWRGVPNKFASESEYKFDFSGTTECAFRVTWSSLSI